MTMSTPQLLVKVSLLWQSTVMEVWMKYVLNLLVIYGKFENLDTFPFSNEIASSMNNAANDDTFKTPDFPSAEDAFGTNSNDDLPY